MDESCLCDCDDVVSYLAWDKTEGFCRWSQYFDGASVPLDERNSDYFAVGDRIFGDRKILTWLTLHGPGLSWPQRGHSTIPLFTNM